MREIIDAHVHILPPVRLRGLLRWIIRAFPEHPVDPRIDEEGILRDLDGSGVRFFFNYVYPLNAEETDALNEFNNGLGLRVKNAAPFGSLHIETPDKAAVVRRCIEEFRFVGLKFHPFVQGFDPSDERLFIVYELMEEYQKPVVLHTGFDEFYKKSMPPARIESILKRFPLLPLVISHALFPRFEEARFLLEAYPNLFIDATNVFGALRLYAMYGEGRGGHGFTREALRLSELFLTIVTEHTERTLFGSDHPAGMGGLEDIYRDFFAFGLPVGTEDAIVRKNPRSFIERFSPEVFEQWRVLETGKSIVR